MPSLYEGLEGGRARPLVYVDNWYDVVMMVMMGIHLIVRI